MKASEIEALRAVIADESRLLTERRDAAAHLIRLQVAAVPDATGDDAEVVHLMKPWPRDTDTQRWLADTWSNTTGGRSVNGWSSRDAIPEVTARHRLRLLLATIVNIGLSELERIAAVELLMSEHLHPEHTFNRNRLSPASLLEKIRDLNGTKWEGHDRVPLARPPIELSDVWD